MHVIAADGDAILYLSDTDPSPAEGWVKVSATRWQRPAQPTNLTESRPNHSKG